MIRIMAVITALGLAAFITPVHAGVVTYTFDGTCTDCSGTVTAQLVVQDYTAGSELTSGNLVSFTYGGSNLVSSFTSLPTDPGFSNFNGVLPDGLPGAAIVDVSDSTVGLYFNSSDNGDWSVGSTGGGNFNNPNVSLDDVGTQGIWTLASDPIPSGVPEPASLAMLFLPGLIVLSRLHKRPAAQAEAGPLSV